MKLANDAKTIPHTKRFALWCCANFALMRRVLIVGKNLGSVIAMVEYQVYLYVEQYVNVEANSIEEAEELALYDAEEVRAKAVLVKKNGRWVDVVEELESENDQ